MKIKSIIDIYDDMNTEGIDELSGSIYMNHDCIQGVEDDEFNFYCGPEVEGGFLSDSIYIDDYLKKICENLDIDACIGAAENFHSIKANSIEDGIRKYKIIKDAIQREDIKVN